MLMLLKLAFICKLRECTLHIETLQETGLFILEETQNYVYILGVKTRWGLFSLFLTIHYDGG